MCECMDLDNFAQSTQLQNAENHRNVKRIDDKIRLLLIAATIYVIAPK